MKTQDQSSQSSQQGDAERLGGVEAEGLPRDPRTGATLAPRTQPGYYPGFSTLGQQRFWDAATRDVVLRRVREVPGYH
ncbi:MAG TPA: hypothetical protein VID72_02870, partial [Ktedonobacterales bacterium]